LTDSGSINVNGIVASNYIPFKLPSGYLSIGDWKVASYQWLLSHLALGPRRLYCTFAIKSCEKESYNNNGIALWVAASNRAARWWLDQKPAVKSSVGAFVLIFLLCIHAKEMLLMYPWMVIPLVVVIAIALPKKHATSNK
jgi:hypothetical protein